MRILDLALKDIRQVLRDWKSLLFLLIMPVVFTFFFGFAFAGPTDEVDTRLKVGILNQDPDGILSAVLIDLLNSSATVRPVDLSGEERTSIDQMVLKGEIAAGLVIPTEFSAATLRGEEPVMEVITDEETNAGQTMRRALQTNVTRLLGLVETAQLSAEAYGAQVGFTGEVDRQTYLEEAVAKGLTAWKEQPLAIQVEGPAQEADPLGANPYNQFSPGMMVQFAIFGLVQAAMVLVTERRTGAMARLLTTPMRKAELIAGHILGMFLLFFVQQLLLALFGQIVLKVDYVRQPVAVLCMIAAIALWVSTLGLLISALVKKEEQVILFAMVAMMVFSALGGSWFSLEMVGGAFAAVGYLTPTAWAMDGLQNLIIRGLGFESILLPVGVLLAYTGLFFGLAVWRFKFE